MSKQEDFRRCEKPLEKMREIDNEASVSEEAKIKRKFNGNQKCITLSNIQPSSLIFLFQANCHHQIVFAKFSFKNLFSLPQLLVSLASFLCPE